MGAIPVVKIEVHDEDTLRTTSPKGVLSADGHVVEETESHSLVGLGMVAGWPDEGEGIADFVR